MCFAYFHHCVASEALLELQTGGISLKMQFILGLRFEVENGGVAAIIFDLGVALLYCLLNLVVDLGFVGDHNLGGQTLLIFSHPTTPLF